MTIFYKHAPWTAKKHYTHLTLQPWIHNNGYFNLMNLIIRPKQWPQRRPLSAGIIEARFSILVPKLVRRSVCASSLGMGMGMKKGNQVNTINPVNAVKRINTVNAANAVNVLNELNELYATITVNPVNQLIH